MSVEKHLHVATNEYLMTCRMSLWYSSDKRTRFGYSFDQRDQGHVFNHWAFQLAVSNGRDEVLLLLSVNRLLQGVSPTTWFGGVPHSLD